MQGARCKVQRGPRAPDKIRNCPRCCHGGGRTVGLPGTLVGPGEAWKEAHAQAWDSAGRVPGAWKTGLALTPQACSATRSPHCCSVLQVLAVHAAQCPGALAVCAFPSPLVAWTTASDRLKKDPGRAPQHDRGRHWPGVEATRGPAPGNNKAALDSLLSCKHTVWPMTTCSSVSLPPAHTAGKTHIYVAARLHPEAQPSFSSQPQASIRDLLSCSSCSSNPSSPSQSQPQPATLDQPPAFA